MKKNPKTSASDLAKTLGIADRNVKNHIKTLKEAGFIERVGSPKGGYWVVSEKSVFSTALIPFKIFFNRNSIDYQSTKAHSMSDKGAIGER